MIRRWTALLTLLLLALVVPASRAGAYEAHVLRWSDGLDVTTLNPLFASSGNIATLSELTMAHFVRFDAKGNAIPELITVVPSKANGGISADGKTLTFHLRRGVRWSDGAPFDASDVIYTIAVIKNPTSNIASRDFWDRIASYDAPDAYTVRFHLHAAYSAFLSAYFASSVSQSAVLPKHILGPGLDINTAPYNGLPVGIGPFRYTAFRRGDAVEMEANPYYWRGKPKLQKIVYKLVTEDNTILTQLQTGELDLWDGVNGTYAERAKALPGKANLSRLTLYMSGVFFNTSHPQLADPAVRRALRLATDRTSLFEKVALRNGALTESVLPKVTRNYLDLPQVPYDPARAQQQLDALGWKRGADGMRSKNGVPLSIDIVLPAGYGPSATAAALLRDDWAAIGVAVTSHAYGSNMYFAPYASGGIINTGKFDVALLSQSLNVYANINNIYDCNSIEPHGLNTTRYCNHAVDAANDRYLASFDPREQQREADFMQRTLDDAAPIVVTYERAFVAVFDERLTGFHPHAFSFWGDPLDVDL